MSQLETQLLNQLIEEEAYDVAEMFILEALRFELMNAKRISKLASNLRAPEKLFLTNWGST